MELFKILNPIMDRSFHHDGAHSDGITVFNDQESSPMIQPQVYNQDFDSLVTSVPHRVLSPLPVELKVEPLSRGPDEFDFSDDDVESVLLDSNDGDSLEDSDLDSDSESQTITAQTVMSYYASKARCSIQDECTFMSEYSRIDDSSESLDSELPSSPLNMSPKLRQLQAVSFPQSQFKLEVAGDGIESLSSSTPRDGPGLTAKEVGLLSTNSRKNSKRKAKQRNIESLADSPSSDWKASCFKKTNLKITIFPTQASINAASSGDESVITSKAHHLPGDNPESTFDLQLSSFSQDETLVDHVHAKRFENLPTIKELIQDNSSKHRKLKVWIQVDQISQSRVSEIMQMAKTRKLRCFEVEKIIEIFLLRNIAIKLRILSHPALLGNGVSYNRTLVADKGLCCKEIGSHLYVEGKTHAGHERVNSSSENSIMENFVHITEIAIYFRTPTDTTTDRPKNKPTAGRLGTPKIVLQKPYNTRSSIKKSPGSKTVLPKIVSQSTTIDHKYIKRPLNSFMLYRAAMSRVYTLLCLVNCLTGFINENLGWKSPRIDWKQNADSATTIENGVLSYDLANELEFLREIETLVQKGDPKTLEKIRATLTLPKLNHHMCVHVIAMLWQTESESTKQEFSALAVLEKELHSKCYPNYKYNPRKREIDPVYWGKE